MAETHRKSVDESLDVSQDSVVEGELSVFHGADVPDDEAETRHQHLDGAVLYRERLGHSGLAGGVGHVGDPGDLKRERVNCLLLCYD